MVNPILHPQGVLADAVAAVDQQCLRHCSDLHLLHGVCFLAAAGDAGDAVEESTRARAAGDHRLERVGHLMRVSAAAAAKHVHVDARLVRHEDFITSQHVSLDNGLAAEIHLHHWLLATKLVKERVVHQGLASRFVEELSENLLGQGLEQLHLGLQRLLAGVLSLHVALDTHAVGGRNKVSTAVLSHGEKQLTLSTHLPVCLRHGICDAGDKHGGEPQRHEAGKNRQGSLAGGLQLHVGLHARRMHP
mmetsp:Transcript_30672/g.70843  ORF Transcript_30672/g.70843 Transcript_30672/m.70843 type:complete len:247 (-) Transcript_30672:1422-2162(-)